MKNKNIRGLVVGGIVFLVTVALFRLGAFRVLEWKSWDLRLQLFARASEASDDIVLFLIDQESLDVYHKEQELSWPWPRQMYSAIIQYCKKAGAKALVLDFLFSESSVFGPDDDQDLARNMREAGNVFLPFSLHPKPKGIEGSSSSLLRRFSLAPSDVPAQAVFPAKDATLPLDIFLDSAKGVGNVQYVQDSDGIFRRIPLVFELNGLLLPSLTLALAEECGAGGTLRQIPLDRTGSMIIRYHGPSGTYAGYSVAAIINSFYQLETGMTPQLPPETFKDKIILVGGSAPGLLDLRPTPFSAVNPGVEIQATVIDNILNRDFVRILPELAIVLFILFLSLLTALGTSLLAKAWKTVLFAFCCLSLPVALSAAGFLSGYWLDFAAPEFAVVLSFIAASVLNYSFEGRQRRFIKSAFRFYLSPDVIDRVLENPSLLRLGGEKREITSFFSDVAGFTSISENLSPEELVNLLNEYLSEMTDIILDSGGTLDKYEGDAIIAFWNAPLDQPDHALRACRAALSCQRRLDELRPRFQERYGHGLTMRIGLNTGPAVVGNMGSGRRFDYTAMGDTINLASRLEGACKQYGVPILVGEKTHIQIGAVIQAREVDLIRVVGKAHPVRVYEIAGEGAGLPPALLENYERYQRALALYRGRQWDEAVLLFRKWSDDPLSQKYVERIMALKESPPPEDWTGVYDLKQK